MNKTSLFLKLKMRGLRCIQSMLKPFFRFNYFIESVHRKLHIKAGAATYIVERSDEYAFTLSNLPHGNNLRVLDIGTGSTAFGATLKDCRYSVDCLENSQYRRGRLPLNSHCNLINGDILKSSLPDNHYDAVTCISVLEHIEQYDLAVENMAKTLKPGGILVLTFPYNHEQFIADSYSNEQSNRHSPRPSYICNVYSKSEIENWCSKSGLEIKKQKFYNYWTGPFWNSGEIRYTDLEVTKDQKHDLCCVALKKPENNPS
jgi:2-polyprenyl-3-methyl-5-hydroxy-6-metoxy-1,4-benzoquinol methylase